MKKVIGVGACVLDTYIEMDSYPKEDIKIRANRVFSCGGGPVGNALVGIAKLGVQAAYLGSLSNDAYGHQLVDEFKQFGVCTNNIKLLDNIDAFKAFIILGENKGTRTVLFDKGTIPDDPSLLNLEAIQDFDVLHLDGNFMNLAIESAKIAKKYHKIVSLDAGSPYPRVEELLPYVDILIPSESFALKFTGKDTVDDAIMDLYLKYKPKVLVVTQGPRGGTYIEDEKVHHYEAFKINCIDSNGAGDIFHGAFLVAYLEGKSLLDSIYFASATSALKCMKVGVRNALPNKNEVEAFLKARGK